MRKGGIALSNNVTKRELVALLIEHLPPLSDAINNLTKSISMKESLSLNDLEGEDFKILMSNLKVAIRSMRELTDKVSEITRKVRDPEMISLLTELHEGAMELNLVGIEELLIWLSKEEDDNDNDEAVLKEIVHKLFLGSQSISQLVNKLIE